MGRKKSLTYDTSQPELVVYLYERRVGTIGQTEDGNVWFKYDPTVVADSDPTACQLSVKLPLTTDSYGPEETKAFFDNLLLESDLRAEMATATKHESRDTTGLLGQIGGECAGAVAIWPIGMQPPVEPEYTPIAVDALERLFVEAHGARLMQIQINARQTMSGVQQKLVLRKVIDQYALPIDGAPTTLLMKGTTGRYPGLALNEHLCLRLFASLGLPVNESRVIGGPDGLLQLTRFDRVVAADGSIRRLHQEDFCQATGRLPQRKYQMNNGPAFADVANVVRRHSVAAALDIQHLVRAAIAHVCLGNMDAHGKNYALLTTDAGKRLAPFYDIVCTEAYPWLDRELSMNIGSTRNPQRLTTGDLQRFAREVNVTPALVMREARDVVQRLRAQIPETTREVTREVGAHPILLDMQEVFARRLSIVESIVTENGIAAEAAPE